jgi:hypothetical protein
LSLFLDASIILLQKPFFFLALVVIVTKIVWGWYSSFNVTVAYWTRI